MAILTERDRKLAKRIINFLDKNTVDGVVRVRSGVIIEHGKKIFYFKLASVADINLATIQIKKFGLIPYEQDEWENPISFIEKPKDNFGGVF